MESAPICSPSGACPGPGAGVGPTDPASASTSVSANQLPCATRRRLCRLAAWAAATGPVPWAWAALPAALCGAAPAPAYPPAGQPALVQSWLQEGHQDGPTPDCRGLRDHDFELLVRVTASYAAPGDLDAQLVRIGAVSRLTGATYWSFSDRKRLVLFQAAFAVDAAGSLRPRADFSAAELRSGAELHFVHSDNRSSELSPYSLRLAQTTADAFQVQIENSADLRYLGLLLLAAREMQWSVSIERLGPGRWGYRSLLGIRHLHLGRAEQHRLSNLARCVAMFDLLAGRQTEIEPYR